jgi:type IV secretion system protein VirD4
MRRQKLLDGWSSKLALGFSDEEQGSLGFDVGPKNLVAKTRREDVVFYDGDAPLCTIAPTRSGKGRGVLIPNLLCYSGPCIVLDLKGELASVTARRRREMGQDVYIVDPTHYLGTDSASLNPFDALLLPGVDIETDAMSLAELLSRGIKGTKEPFWDLQGSSLLQALIIDAVMQPEPEKRHLGTVIDMLSSDDMNYNMAVMLDTRGKSMNKLAYQTISQVLQMPDVTRGGVTATAQAYLKPLMSTSMIDALRTSSFPLQRIIDGDPITVYLVMPPHRLPALRGLVKVLMGGMINAVLSRRVRPNIPTYLVLDEVGQLESFPLLETLMTLSSGYGTLPHLVFQDMAQLKTYYPESWKTILNNCAVLQTFGINNGDLASQFAGYLDVEPTKLMRLGRERQALSIQGRGTLVCGRCDYLRDAPRRFFDDNPLFGKPANPSR